MKKRILQLIPSFHQGGTERRAVSLTKMLDADGTFDVFAATLNDAGVLRDDFGMDVAEFPLTSFYNANFVRQVRRFSKYLTDNKIDIIHTHDFYTNLFGMAAASLAGTPVRIASKRETGGIRTLAQDFVEKLAFGRATAIVANSRAVRDCLVARGIAADKIDVIYNGIDLERFANLEGDSPEARAKFGLPTDEKIRFITMIANLRHPVKNVPMLLRVAKQVTAAHPHAHFVIAGEGDLRDELEQTAKRLGVTENVHFLGRCSDVPNLLYLSYACVLTSIAEGFSNSILEYMAAGKPVVATNVGGAAEAVVDEVTGWLVGNDDDTSMAAKILQLLSDPSMTKMQGDAPRRFAAENFSNDIFFAKVLDEYSK